VRLAVAEGKSGVKKEIVVACEEVKRQRGFWSRAQLALFVVS
jgi:hypothetical protein